VRVRFWGVRGSIPAPGPETLAVGGNTACVQVTGDDGTQLILDAGSGIRGLAPEELGPAKRLDILLTHLHLDHIHGLLFFAPLFDPQKEITVWGPPGRVPLRTRLARYLSSPLSPIEIGELPAKVVFKDVPPGRWRLGAFELRASFVAHRGPTLGFRISQRDTILSYIPDHEPALGTALESAPANWVSGLTLARNSTALIHDAQYSESEYASRRGWGHSSFSDALAFARRAEPERLLFFHHDPEHEDGYLQTREEQAREESSGLGLGARVELAREGQSLEL
jgi:phosphoribosyl 1,2-cyclic phosphodiesterase